MCRSPQTSLREKTLHHWALDYLGKPWVRAGRGPDAFDCVGLFMEIQKKIYGRDVSDLSFINLNSAKSIARAFWESPEAQKWQPTNLPKAGDGVAMYLHSIPNHVGVVMDDLHVIHAYEGQGVIRSDLGQLINMGFSRVEYHGYCPDAPI